MGEKRKTTLNRRTFLASCGACLIPLGKPVSPKAAEDSEPLLSGAAQNPDGSFSAVLFEESGRIVRRIKIPERGHDIAWDPANRKAVSFSRRPGIFAAAFSAENQEPPEIFTSGYKRHFYGHGAFSPNGKLLYAAENDYENSGGVVGIYSVADGYKRVGEFPSYGVGPHEIKMMPDGKNLAVANGGLETHPDYGRIPLNLDSMNSNLAIIDIAHGTLLHRYSLPRGLGKLSIRHLDIAASGKIFFGCQFKGSLSENAPLIGQAGESGSLRLWKLPNGQLEKLDNYIGSVSLDANGENLMVSSPKGNTAMILSTRSGQIKRIIRRTQISGLAGTRRGFYATTLKNDFGKIIGDSEQRWQKLDLRFDNHISLSSKNWKNF